METRKTEILQITTDLIKIKGYNAVTMRDIAKAMGIKASSLYNHIDSKQAILSEIIMALALEFTEGIQEIEVSDACAIDKLKRIIEQHVKVATQNNSAMAVLNDNWMHLETELKSYLALRKAYEKSLVNILNSGMTSGEIIKADPAIVMFSMLSTLRSLYLWIPKKSTRHTSTLTSELSSVLLGGIAARHTY